MYKFLDFIKENDYWGNIAGGALIIAKSTGRILIVHRSLMVKEPLTWGIVGGKLDIGDDNTIQDAIIREIEEELDYSGNIILIPSYIFKDKNFEYHNFIGLVEKEFEPILNWESKDYKWVTFDELLNINNKHFGLRELLNNDKEKISKYAK
jgi:8-oxo-dGTP pyrophosphatase MutT (NUDIX family)